MCKQILIELDDPDLLSLAIILLYFSIDVFEVSRLYLIAFGVKLPLKFIFGYLRIEFVCGENEFLIRLEWLSLREPNP